MRVVIAGGHGKIARLLAARLAGRGDQVIGLIRDPGHTAELEVTGAQPVVADLERTSAEAVAGVLSGADAAVFAAGAGPGSGAARKYTVDRDGSVLLADAAEAAGVRRFVQVSTMGAGKPPAAGRGEVWAAYIDAKTQAEADLRERDLAWTILRPGRLTEAPGTGAVTLAPPPIPAGEVPRADVAAVLAALLDTPAARTLELTAGTTPLDEAIAAASA